jgi:hypothetical protein
VLRSRGAALRLTRAGAASGVRYCIPALGPAQQRAASGAAAASSGAPPPLERRLSQGGKALLRVARGAGGSSGNLAEQVA